MNMTVEEPLIDFVSDKVDYKIFNDDALERIKKFETEKFKLIITSPPYNIGKEYETKTSIEKYLETQEEIIDELIRVLSPEGSVCWQVGNFVEDGEIFPLDIFYYQIFKKYGLKLRNRIVWHFGHGLHASNRFSGRYETILWFSKTNDYTFNLDPVRIPSKYPGKRHYKGPNKGKLSGNPKGKNPSDVWEVMLRDWEKELWEFPNVKSNHPEKTDHPCQYPVELVERCVLALTNDYDWVLDPFSGVGSTLIASLKNKRNVIGIDKEKEYCKLAEKRVNQLKEGTIKLRPMTKEIYKPKKNSKIVQIPLEWKTKKENEV